MIISHYNLLKKDKGTKTAIMEIKTHALWYLKKIKNSKPYKQKISLAKSEDEFYKIINELRNYILKNK